jgi:hypothetical protein
LLRNERTDLVFNLSQFPLKHFLQILQNLEFTYGRIPAVITEILIM